MVESVLLSGEKYSAFRIDFEQVEGSRSFMINWISTIAKKEVSNYSVMKETRITLPKELYEYVNIP